MDLLEVINKCADSHRRVKEATIRYGGHGELCELNSVILIVRDGNPEVGLIVDDVEMRAGFACASMNFMPDALVLTRDGVSLKNNRRELATIAISRAGEILWKIYPYAVIGDMFLGNGFEVPDEMPLLDADTVADEMRKMMREATEPPLHMSQHWPDREKAVAEMDVILSKSLRSAPAELQGIIEQVQLFSSAGTGRQDVLLAAGMPVVLL